MKFAITLPFLLISASIATAATLQSESHEWTTVEESASSSSLSSGLTRVSVRGWQERALEKATNELYTLKKELRMVEAIYKCEKKKSKMLRDLFRKKKSSPCSRRMNGKDRKCHKRYGLRKQVKRGQRMCRRNKSCLKKYVWPLQWKLKKLMADCKCENGASIMKMIWKTKKIRCGKGRKAWKVKKDIGKLKKRITYLEKMIMIKPSVAPRPKRE